MSTAPRYQVSAEHYRGTATEAQWQATVVDMARHYGWHVTHVREMRGNPHGLPDLLCFRGNDYLLLELKTERGRVSPVQDRWHQDAGQCGVTVHVLRPSDVERAEEMLR